MTTQEIIRGIIRVTGNTQSSVARKSGMIRQSNISMLLQSKSMRVDSLLAILTACGYELVARSITGEYPEYRFSGIKAPNAEPCEEPKRDEHADMAGLSDLVRKIISEEFEKRGKNNSEEVDADSNEEGEKPE